MLAAACLSCGAEPAWRPGPEWKDTPDPMASVMAKKGGVLRFNGAQAPKSLNAYIDNNSYTMMTFSLMYENMLGTDSETLDFVPGLARRWAVSDDGTEFTFEIDGDARWSDGRAVSAADVKWTFDTVLDSRSDTGVWKVMLGAFESPETLDARTVRFRKKPGSDKDWRDLFHCAFFPVLPKHALEGRDFNKVDFLGVPVSGPYRLSRVDEQVETEFSRVESWWRGNMPSCRHVCNFDKIVMRYYVDNENAFEALKKRAIDIYPVYSARIMSSGATGEKFDRNWILRRRVSNRRPMGFQGFAMNMRRFPFDDIRARRAMAMLVDRETMNRTMMFNEYFLLKSYFSDLYDDGHPCGNPDFRYDPGEASRILDEAGWRRGDGGTLVRDGREFRFTFLSRSGSDDKFLALFNHSLQLCGIKMDIVRKDFAGWMRDMDDFNYQMTWAAWGAGVFRNPEPMWRSREADRRCGSNITGFKSDEVDRLIVAEKSMDRMSDRLDAYRRIDRLIADQVPYVLLWHTADTRLLYWNKFGMPDTVLGRYGNEENVLTYWWYDADRAAELDEAVGRRSFLPSVPIKVDFDEVMAR